MSEPKKPFQKHRIRELLEEDGWTIETAEYPLEWWQDEIWIIRSTWTPRGISLILTFVTDPDILQNTWTVRVSNVPLTDNHDRGAFQLDLRNKWEDGLCEFVEYLSDLRTSSG